MVSGFCFRIGTELSAISKQQSAKPVWLIADC
jgi:hypothetical protein